MKKSDWMWPAILILSSIGVALAVLGDYVPMLRPFITLWFMLVCPGMAIARLLGIKDSLHEFVTGVALSLALESAIASTMVYTGTWSPELGLRLLIGLCLAGALLQVIYAQRNHMYRGAF